MGQQGKSWPITKQLKSDAHRSAEEMGWKLPDQNNNEGLPELPKIEEKSEAEIEELKLKFAELYLTFLAYFDQVAAASKAAGLVWPENQNDIVWHWVPDPTVQAHCRKLIDERGIAAFSRNDAEVLNFLWARMQNMDDKALPKAMEVFGKLSGKITNNTTINDNRMVDKRCVMVVKDHGTDEEWERKLLEQQTKLIEG